MRKTIAVSLVCIMLCGLGGCASNYSGTQYAGHSETRQAQTVQYGHVVSVQDVMIEENQNGTLGAIGGGVAGGVLGSLIGHGRGSVVASVGGAMLGAGAGYLAEKSLGKQRGYEITVELDNTKEHISVVQGADISFAEGERVRVLTNSNGSARVIR